MARKANYPDGTHAIDTGLYVRKKGAMASFFVRVQKDGKRHDIGLGSVRTIDEATAKRMAMEIRVDVARGATPWIRKKRDDKSGPPTFCDFFPDAFRRYAEAAAWKTRQTEDDRRKLVERFAMPYIKDVRMDLLSVGDVVNLLLPVWKESVLKGDRLRAVLVEIFDRAVADGHMKENPATWDKLRFYLPSRKRPKVKHHAALEFDECRIVLKNALISGSVTANVIVMVMLTARRVSEVLMARWDEVDLESFVWKIPDERMKISRGAPRRVPIPRQLAEAMSGWERRGEFIFQTGINRHANKTTVLRTLRRMTKKAPTVHGFRSTFIDWCAEHDVPVEVAEKCLDHESGSQVRRAYQRSDLFEQRREVLQRYADALFTE